MNENITKRNELLAQKVIQGLKSRNMTGYYAKNKEKALAIALDLIPEGASVTMGGCMSAREIGLIDAISEGDYNFIDRDNYADKRAAMLMAYDADVFLSSANAMTDDGILVNMDGTGNRVAAALFGHEKVYYVAGVNKICPDLDHAIWRLRNIAAPRNCLRKHKATPCAKRGDRCYNCASPERICNGLLIEFKKMSNMEMEVVLVGECLGL